MSQEYIEEETFFDSDTQEVQFGEKALKSRSQILNSMQDERFVMTDVRFGRDGILYAYGYGGLQQSVRYRTIYCKRYNKYNGEELNTIAPLYHNDIIECSRDVGISDNHEKQSLDVIAIDKGNKFKKLLKDKSRKDLLSTIYYNDRECQAFAFGNVFVYPEKNGIFAFHPFYNKRFPISHDLKTLRTDKFPPHKYYILETGKVAKQEEEETLLHLALFATRSAYMGCTYTSIIRSYDPVTPTRVFNITNSFGDALERGKFTYSPLRQLFYIETESGEYPGEVYELQINGEDVIFRYEEEQTENLDTFPEYKILLSSGLFAIINQEEHGGTVWAYDGNSNLREELVQFRGKLERIVSDSLGQYVAVLTRDKDMQIIDLLHMDPTLE